ncbi:MAG: histidinol-phosphate transaminase [Candidatus Methylomirabilis oxygeniifera]|uniref:Histidinol-phosphate aminotransferase n=1 Tax=Methylomirabilis oxygeniifera TaxID=671143 RepID=D5MI01_METO1|nr:MAG: histidinol-phosphate transaminase [Candidatus Methylomirabilis oxyfera]CBE69294.1 Histidinol-phosphate aminotransferase 2 (Imidazole acetol-phosphate transaminase 2) [Candidatus Methylomirabilis oxyfera]
MKRPRLLDLIKPEVLSLTAYRAEEPRPGLIKLDANESPFLLPEELRRELRCALDQVDVHRYPDAKADRLRSVLAAQLRVSPESLVLGNGSDELIQLLLLATSGPGATALAPVPTFSMYELIARAHGLRFEGVPLGPRFEPDLPTLIETIERLRPRIIFLATPNNPTGGVFSEAEICKILAVAPGLVVVDEAYGPYAGRTMLPHLIDQERLVILHSLSKIGLAGLRIGYLVAHPALAAEIEKVRLPFNLNSFSQTAAVVLLNHHEWIDANIGEVVRERERVMGCLVALPGVEAFPSAANFILFRTTHSGGDLFGALLQQGVLVRNIGSVPGLQDCLRVTVGTKAENNRFVEALTKALKQD